MPLGVLREMADPLGVGAGSDAFSELTGFSLDKSELERPPGFLWLPVPGAMGLFAECQGEGSAMLGAFLNSAPARGWRAESALCLAEQARTGFGDTWYGEEAPNPGGSLLLAAGRVRAMLPGLQMSATLGGSMGERLRPGWFIHLQGSAHAGPVEAALLFGGSGGDYRVPSGAAPDAAWRVSGRTRIAVGESTAEIVYSMDVARPGFAPRPFLAERQEVSAGWERGFRVIDGLAAAIRFDARKIIRTDPEGETHEEAGCSGRISVVSRRVQADVSLGWSWETGPSAGAGLSIASNDDLRLKVHGGWSLDDEELALEVSWRIKEGGAPGLEPVP